MKPCLITANAAFLLNLFFGPMTYAQEENRQPKHFYFSVAEIVRAINSAHLVVATRETSETGHLVRFADLWFDGDAVQCKEMVVNGPLTDERWWDGFDWEDEPYSSLTLVDSVLPPSTFRVYNGSNSPKEAFFVPDRKGELTHAGTYEAKALGGLFTGVYAPLVGLNREWKFKTFELENLMTLTTADDWEVVGDEIYKGEETVKIRIRFAIRNFAIQEGGDLGVARVRYLWLSKPKRLAPVRMLATTEYFLEGLWYPLVDTAEETQFSESYEVSDFLVFSGSFYPSAGRLFQKAPVRSESSKSANPSKIAQAIRDDKVWVDQNTDYVERTFDWKVLRLDALEPGINLWVEPPLNSLVFEGDTKFIEGKTREESQRLLGIIDPLYQAAEPLPKARNVKRIALVVLIATLLLVVLYFRNLKNSRKT